MQTLSYGSCFSPDQEPFARRVRSLIKDAYGESPKACVITYGCQQNVSDSERLKGQLEQMGFSFTDKTDEADFLIFNTCAVRGHAEDRVYGNIGAMKHVKRKKPGMLLCVCGCMVQQPLVAERFRSSYPHVDILFGTHVSHRLPEFIYNRLNGSGRIFEISNKDESIVEDIPVRRDGDLKGFLPIMYGCNNFCTYCVVPYVRGRERSREPEKILHEARGMVKSGFKEITLLGQNVNSYGKGEPHGINFAKLLRMINDIEGEFRIRFMTSHPKDCTAELLDTMRDCEKIARHLHLPIQSGSDKILKAMNRYYNTADYLGLISAARERMPDLSLTSDIIVGFPGETYEDFSFTLDIIKEIGYSSLFTFIYSPRQGTPAADMPDPVSREEKGRWFSELLLVQEKETKSGLQKLVGRKVRVLCDEIGRDDGIMSGHTPGTATVEFAGDVSLLGKFITVRIDSYNGVLQGTII